MSNLLPNINLDNPLFRKENSDAGCTYFLAYRTVFLQPTSPTPPNIASLLPDKTISINIAPQGPTLTVFAEEIVLLTGSRYHFPGTNLVIHCRTVLFVNHNPGPVVFDLSADANTTQRADGSQPGNAAAANYSLGMKSFLGDPWTCNMSLLSNKTLPAKGETGSDGSAGQPGGTGGSFALTCDFVCEDISKYSLQILTRGGTGSPGGNGGKGGKGGNGVMLLGLEEVSIRENSVTVGTDVFFWLLPLYRPAFGGNGGKGAPGGCGGNSADINITFTINGKKATDDQKSKLFLTDTSVGTYGKDGDPGASGDVGDKPQYILKSTIWESDYNRLTELPSFVDKVEAKYQPTAWVPFTGPAMNITNCAVNLNNIEAEGDNPTAGTVIARDPKQAAPKAGNVVISSVDSLTSMTAICIPDFRYMAMLVDRLVFEHFINYTMQKYTSPNPQSAVNTKSIEQLVTPFIQSKAWIDSIMEELSDVSSDPNHPASTYSAVQLLHLKLLQSNYTALQDSVNRGIDIFCNSVDQVIQPGQGVKKMDEANANYIKLEQNLVNIGQQLLALQGKGDKIRSQVVDSLQAASVSINKRDLLLESLTGLKDKIIVADGLVKTRRVQLESALGHVKQKISDKAQCNIGDILAAISMVAMFFNPEAGTIFAIGAIAEVGGGIGKTITASFNTLDTEAGGSVNKSYLYGRITTMGKDADPTETLREEFKRAEGERQRHVTDYLTQVKTQAAKFDSLCEQYYQIPGVSVGKAAFKQFVDAIQAKNDLLDDYNGAFLKLVSLQADANKAKEIATGLQIAGSADELQTDDLQVAYAFLEQALSDMKKLILYKFYNMVRMYNAVMLTYSEMVAPLASLQSFHGINAVTISSDFDKCFKEQDLPRLESAFNAHKSARTTVRLDLTEKLFPSLFEQLHEGRFTFTLENETACSLGPEGFMDDWFDVRYASVQFYFPGAVKIEPPAPDVAAIIHTTISTFGSSKVIDLKGVCHKFYFPPANTPFSYTYDTKVSKDQLGRVDMKPHSTIVVNDTLHFELESGHSHDVFVQTPLTNWHVDLTEVHSKEELAKNPNLVNKVDMSNCHTIQLCLDIIHRSKGKN